jgi:hypothetical protein
MPRPIYCPSPLHDAELVLQLDDQLPPVLVHLVLEAVLQGVDGLAGDVAVDRLVGHEVPPHRDG